MKSNAVCNLNVFMLVTNYNIKYCTYENASLYLNERCIIYACVLTELAWAAFHLQRVSRKGEREKKRNQNNPRFAKREI